jgi:hypothetical protein
VFAIKIAACQMDMQTKLICISIKGRRQYNIPREKINAHKQDYGLLGL